MARSDLVTDTSIWSTRRNHPRCVTPCPKTMTARRGFSEASLRSASLLFTILLILSGILFMGMPVDRASDFKSDVLSEYFPLIVDGYVRTQSGIPLAGASVDVSVKESLQGQDLSSLQSVSDFQGFFTVTFSPSNWSYGNVIVVIAQCEGDYGSNFSYIDLSCPGFMTVNVTYPLKLVGSSFTMTLVPGWNLVSIPLADHGYKASTLGLMDGDFVASWDSSAQVYAHVYIVGVSPSSMDFDIVPHTGFWVHASANETLVLYAHLATGQLNLSISVPERGGWVLVGFESLNSSRVASDIPPMYSVQGGIKMVVSWNPVTQAYKGYIPQVPGTNFSIVPGCAYWLWCSVSGILSYQA